MEGKPVKIGYKFLILIMCTFSVLLAQIPRQINYQGKLTRPDGVAYHGDIFEITFRIYDSPTSLVELFDETHEAVHMNHGLFDVILGLYSPLRLPFDQPYWLELEVDGETLLPRQPFSAVPYAYRSVNADTALFAFTSRKVLGGSDNYIVRWNGDDELEPSLMYETDAGQIGVGTTTPSDGTRLEVIAEDVAASRAVLAKTESGEQEGWLASEFYGAYGQFD